MAIVMSTTINAKSLANSVDQQPVLVFQIVNSADVPGEVLAHAQKHVQRIYQELGIRTVWVERDGAPEALSGAKRLHLRIVLVNELVAGAMGKGNATGFALSNNGSGARIAYIFNERAEHQAEFVSELRPVNKEVLHGLILGHVIAHEAGHLMLPPNGHSSTGIMRSKMDMDSVDRALQGRLLFQPEQQKLIRAALMAQAKN